MDMKHESEWKSAQNITISEDLVSAAKLQLQFLAAVDSNRWLYGGQTLQWAIYRYNSCWLPLLAKHSKSHVTKGPLVVPLDCEWVWHCHRLNPVRYKSDCEEFYGRILDNHHVASSVEGISKKETEEMWNKLYPNEPYDINLSALPNEFSEKIYRDEKHTKYNLVLAIERQVPFFYQVSRPHMNNDHFLEAALARYKGFLHLIKRNKERSIRCFCVPTYDIDLIWHTHQLHPSSYCKDSVDLLGKILEHDDTDQKRGKGQKLDVGFSQTTKQWEKMFGSRYWKAGAMYRGTPKSVVKKVVDGFQKSIDLPEANVIEVVLEFLEIKNIPETHKKKVGVFFSKAKPDGIFDGKRKLNIESESGKKQVATFHCEATGSLLFELVSELKTPSTSAEIMGCCAMSLKDFFTPVANLCVEKWLDLVPVSGTVGNSEPIRVRFAASCTPPFSKSSIFSPLSGEGEVGKTSADETGYSSGCGGGCGGGCGNMVKSGGCGSGCGGGCGIMVKSGGCGSGCGCGCGGGCGNMVNSGGGCGGGCGGCGGGCGGGGCGGGCGSMAKSGGLEVATHA